MAATLKICIIVHVEDTVSPDFGLPSGSAAGLQSLARVIGPKSAKLSVQFGRRFLDSNDSDTHKYTLTGPSSLVSVLSYGGNFWTHTHSADYNNLVTIYNCVRSAFQNEGGTGVFPAGGVGGRSGGWDFSGADWVSITQAAGIRVMNSTAMGAHALVPLTARPYGITDEEIDKFHPKGPAPGPIYADVMTMRQRPFWMSVSSDWFAQATTVNTLYVGSVMMIPAAGKLDLNGLAEGRAPSDSTPFTDDDLKCAVSQAWAAYQNVAYQSTVPNVWYTHLPIANVSASASSMMGNFVDSINNLFQVGGGSPLAEWKNMNEIASIYGDPTLW